MANFAACVCDAFTSVAAAKGCVRCLDPNAAAAEPAGTMDAGTGHHHLVVDTDLPEAGVAIPSTPGVHIHMGKAQTEMELTDLAPGEHIVIAVVGDGAHVPLDPWVADTVGFVVP